MGGLSNRELLTAPFALTGAMLVIAVVTDTMAGIDNSMLLWPYLASSVAVTVLCLLCSVFWWVLRLAVQRADAPVGVVMARLRSNWVPLLLPAIAFPLFLASYTSSKSAIPFLVGYHWDRFWADADAMIFGTDAWRIAHHWLGSSSMPIWELFYTVGWGTVLFFSSALVAIHAKPRTTAIFYTAMISTWIIGGWMIAYAFSAAGPVFAHLFDADLADRFSELRRVLDANLTPNGAIRQTQQYLAATVDQRVAVKGGGISAMPSMHLGAATIYILAAWGTRWIVPACLFWIVILVGSAYFGYHYWIDGIVAAGVAGVCWKCSTAYFARPQGQAAALTEATNIA